MRHRILLALLGAMIFWGSIPAEPARAQEPEALADLSALDSLLNIRVSAAAKYNQTTREAPAAVTVLTAEEIEHFGYGTLGEALANQPGFYASYDRNYFYLGVRGFSRPTDYNNRVLLLLDGHPMNENIYESAFLETTLGLSTDMFERVEIVRGPGSALYGSNAMLAVINVVTKRGGSIDGVSTRAEYGSFTHRQGTALMGREFAGGVDVSVMATWRDANGQDLYFAEFDDPVTNNGVSEGLDWDQDYGVHAKVGYRGFTLALLGTSRKKGIPTAPWEVNFNDDAAETIDERSYAELKFERDLGVDKHVRIRAYHDRYSYDGFYPYEPSDGGMWTDASDGRWSGGEAQLRWDVSPAHRIIFGGELRRDHRADYRWRNEEGDAFTGDWPFTTYSAFAQNESQITSTLALTLGIRVDRYSDQGTPVSPRGAVVYHVTPSSTIKLLYGQAFRAPHRYESHYEEEDWFKVNPNLRPERIRTLELLWQQRVSRAVAGSVSLYSYRIKDLIDETVDPADDLGTFENVEQVNALGAEAALTARFPFGVSAYASYAFQHAKVPDTDELLSNCPKHLLRVGATYEFFDKVTAAAQISYDHQRGTVWGTTTDSFWLANITISTRELLRHFKASFSVRNVFDAYYETPGGWEHIQNGIPQNGRTYRLSLTAKM
jgi:iron complex outermembrane receptor protein